MNIPSFITRHRFSFALAIIIATYLAFGLHHIDQFITADEHYWVEERIPQYWDAISDQKWKKTFINDKPGVSLALVSGIGLIAHPESAGYCEEGADKIIDCATEVTSGLYTSFRFPILIVNAALLILLFFLVSKISDRAIALWTTMFAALSPILLGISQIINPDSLLWSIGGAAVFSYLAFLKTSEKKFLWLTMLFLGFSLLTKYAAFILIPFFFALILGRFLFDRHITDAKKLSVRLKRDFIAWIGITAGAIAILCFFLPALLIDSKYIVEFFGTVRNKFFFATIAAIFLSLFLTDTFILKNRLFFLLRRTLGRLKHIGSLLPTLILTVFIGLVVVRHLFPKWSIFALIPFDIKDLSDARYVTDIPNFFEAFILEWNPLVFSFTPIMLLGLFALLAAMLRRHDRKDRFLPQSLLFLALAYSVLLILSNVLATPRYSILLYPLFAFLAALGISELCQIATKYHRSTRIPTKALATVIVFFGSIASLWNIQPFYTNYSNFLLPQGALISDSWGYGGYEAAQYLNSLPDAKDLTVWSDYYGVCEFFVGRCLTAYTFDPGLAPDYYVLTRRGKIRYSSRHDRWEEKSGLLAYRYYDTPDPVWQMTIDDRPENFIKVVKVDYELRAAVITDIDHCPSRSPVNENRLNDFISSATKNQNDFIISLGDNASHRLRDCSKTADMDARLIAKELRLSGLPVHMVLGDHDIASSVPSYEAWVETAGTQNLYRSFREKNAHIIILDTVLGGEPMREPCEKDSICSSIAARLSDARKLPFAEYLMKYPDTEAASRWQEVMSLKTLLEKERSAIDLVRSSGLRDRGRVSETELAWLEQELKETPLDRVVIFSDHPLFPLVTDKKRYDIANGDKVREILEKSGKKIIAISGEAHVWHEEERNGIRYVVVDQFNANGGSWAFLKWDHDSAPHLERTITTPTAK